MNKFILLLIIYLTSGQCKLDAMHPEQAQEKMLSSELKVPSHGYQADALTSNALSHTSVLAKQRHKLGDAQLVIGDLQQKDSKMLNPESVFDSDCYYNAYRSALRGLCHDRTIQVFVIVFISIGLSVGCLLSNT